MTKELKQYLVRLALTLSRCKKYLQKTHQQADWPLSACDLLGNKNHKEGET